MKFRTLLYLSVAALVLAGLTARLAVRKPHVPTEDIGQRVLRGMDINAVTQIEIESGTQKVALARSAAGWEVSALWGYPAQFDRVAALLRGLDALRSAEVIRGGADLLAELGLDETAEPAPARLLLSASDGQPPVELLLGNPRLSPARSGGFSAPDSRYCRVGRGPVILAEPFIEDVSRRPTDWMAKQVLDLRADAIASITALPANGASYGLERSADGSYSGIGDLEHATINASSAAEWFRAFQGMTVSAVVDPARAPAELGRERADVAIARATNGLVVRVELGAEATPESERYAWFSFAYEDPAPLQTDDAEARAADESARAAARAETDRLQQRVAPWTYQISESTWKRMLFLREQLIAGAPAPDSESTSSAQMPNKPIE